MVPDPATGRILGREPTTAHAWTNRLAATLLAATLLLSLQSYHGIWHDSILYLGQALSVLYPEPFRHDLFFASGSQANYTLAPWLLSQLIKGNDPGTVFKWLTLSGLAAFAIASCGLLRELLPRKYRFPALLALLLLPAFYGANKILSYAEPFLTGRTLAEPLVLVSLTALISGRRLIACVVWGAAALLHPLQALPALAIAGLWLLQGDRRWLKALWIALPALCLALLIPQVQTSFLPMNPTWFEQVQQRDGLVLYFSNGPGSWYNLLMDAFLIAVAIHLSKGALRRYCIAVLGATLVLSLASFVFADLLHLSGPLAFQLWRIHWLANWTAMALLPWLFLELRKQESPPVWPRILVFASVVLFGITPDAAHPMTPSAIVLFVAWPWLGKHLSTSLLKILAISIAIMACTHVFQVFNIPAVVTGFLERMQIPGARVAILVSVAAVLSSIAGTVVWPRFPRALKIASIALLCPALGYAASHWDQRSTQQIAYTQRSSVDAPFGIRLMPQEQILWLDGPLPTWNLLHRPNYMDWVQMAGLVFNRGTAIEGARRKELLHVRDGKNKDCRIVVYPDEAHAACSPDAVAARNACTRTHGELAYFVLPYPLQSEPRGIWALANGRAGTYYLYACKDLLAETTSATAAIPR